MSSNGVLFQICQVCCQIWSPVQLVKNNGKWIYIRPRPANVPGEFKMCDKKGKCIKGASCTFAHSKEELESWNRVSFGIRVDLHAIVMPVTVLLEIFVLRL